jgi:LmbE family N-acetylglucosaminyl deacetylase
MNRKMLAKTLLPPAYADNFKRSNLQPRHIASGLLLLLIAFGLFVPDAFSQNTAARAIDPLPQETGDNGLKLELRKLTTTGQLLQVVAHPDDEDGAMLTLEARGKGISTTLMTLNRGEGGQNKVGSSLFDALGVLRTLELTASDRYYGVEQRFSHVADFGFSKSPEETFQKWGGHDTVLADVVRVIRTFRPDVVVARFSGTSRDGHGHHQASSILTQEAYKAAADPNRFPDQIREGLQPWQAKKLYIGNVCGFGSNTCPDENYTVKLNTGQVDPLLGGSYIQFAMEGLRHQLSQGAGGWSVTPGDRWTFYRLVDSTVPREAGHEKDFFDGIDTSLQGLTDRFGADKGNFPLLQRSLADIAGKIKDADDSSDHPDKAAVPLLQALELIDGLVDRVEQTDLGPQKAQILAILREKRQQCETATNLALNVSLQATVARPKGPESGIPSEHDALTAISPGQTVPLIAKFHNGSKLYMEVRDAQLKAPPGFAVRSYKSNTRTVAPGEDYYANFQLRVENTAEYTRPYWHRNDPATDSVNIIDDPRFQTLPFPPPDLWVEVEYSAESSGSKLSQLSPKHRDKILDSRISVPVVAEFLKEDGKSGLRPVAIVPSYSVMLEPGEQVIPVGGTETNIKVSVTTNLTGANGGKLHLDLPSGWRSEPAEIPVEFKKRGEKQQFEFKVYPLASKEGRAEIRAVLDASGTQFSEGYSLVAREDLASFYYYQPAALRASIVDVKVPNGLKVGYIMGAGDEIPPVLQQIGVDVTLIPPEKLNSEDLTKYGTIVLGIRAYDTQKDVADNNKKLLDYVSSGGALIVQYNASVGEFNSGHFTPYPVQMSRARVSVEEAPVEILAPGDSIFHSPNEITQRDFDGWVQERGLYFADQWDDHFKPLLSCHDPGEPPQNGGLLRAPYGKGTYIYTGYAFFRQLPAGVPGAIRLFVNLLNAGH